MVSLQNLLLWLALSLVGSLVVGCRTHETSPTTKFASVVIRGNTPGQIENVARDVFIENGFRSAPSKSDSLVFERKGSRLDEAAYGGWMNQALWVRVKAAVFPVGEAAFRLECNAYRVEDKGTSTEAETKLWRSSPYQKLLDQVASRLKNKPGPSS
jgi:hypothetical protein